MQIPETQFFSRQVDDPTILKPEHCLAIMEDPEELFAHAEGQPLLVLSVCLPFVIVRQAATDRTVWLDLRQVEVCLVSREYFDAVDKVEMNRQMWMIHHGVRDVSPTPTPPPIATQTLEIDDSGVVRKSACANCGECLRVMSLDEWEKMTRGTTTPMPPPQFICNACEAILYIPLRQE